MPGQSCCPLFKLVTPRFVPTLTGKRQRGAEEDTDAVVSAGAIQHPKRDQFRYAARWDCPSPLTACAWGAQARWKGWADPVVLTFVAASPSLRVSLVLPAGQCRA